jgi:hypothetical protein
VEGEKEKGHKNLLTVRPAGVKLNIQKTRMITQKMRREPI